MKALAIAVSALLYVACPLDGDWIPVVGWADDAVVVWFAARKVWQLMQRSTQ